MNLHAQTQTPGVWGVIPNPAGLDQGFTEMVFLTDTIGYIYGSTTTSGHDMERTNDSGVDFTQLTIQTTLKAPTFGAHMAWPTDQNGYVFADTGHSPANTNFFFRTSNGGTTWVTSVIDPSLQLQNMYFPTPSVGYATGTLTDGSADFVAKTTDFGNSWQKIYSTTNYAFGNVGKLHFIDANNGMFFAQNESTNQVNIAYTTNGGTSFKFVPTGSDSTPNFLHWNVKDSSWLIGLDSVYRSVDSGKHWKSVVPYDTSAGPASIGAFYDDTGFVFRQNEPIVLMTTNGGISWTSSKLPTFGGTDDTVAPPRAASMPSAYTCYLLTFDINKTADVMYKISFTKPGGNTGGVTADGAPEIPFAAMFGNNAITFTMEPAPEARSIQVMDVLGRTCASISLTPNATSGKLGISSLRSGTYFAELGGSVVKFVIP